eukprot:TRINITY_DN1570_c0_g1_i1.p1 TRINITY_DN1570_c0_g1~~TRINITY_DN1570_c0_g1_i1.p1  ORF type:complete len:318 (-),score=49.16 TRINITY_DN1570_c0_g1_i1:232-1158(-)
MTVYETAAYADVKNEWRTAQTAFFRVEITTSQELDVVTTELVELDMTQKNAEDTDFTTNLVANKTPVDTVTVAGAPQSVNPSPYTRIEGDAYTVNFSLLLDLDLFTPFTSLESVTVTFDVNIEITYTPFDGGRRRMRRRLLQTRAQPNRSVSARTSRIIVINLTEDQTVEEVRVQLESEGKKVVVGSPNGDAAQNLESQQPSRRSRADGEMERAQAAKAEESSSDTDNGECCHSGRSGPTGALHGDVLLRSPVVWLARAHPETGSAPNLCCHANRRDDRHQLRITPRHFEAMGKNCMAQALDYLGPHT